MCTALKNPNQPPSGEAAAATPPQRRAVCLRAQQGNKHTLPPATHLGQCPSTAWTASSSNRRRRWSGSRARRCVWAAPAPARPRPACRPWETLPKTRGAQRVITSINGNQWLWTESTPASPYQTLCPGQDTRDPGVFLPECSDTNGTWEEPAGILKLLHCLSNAWAQGECIIGVTGFF